jgi:ribosome-binding ATPase YchF (GTP1/OBG family)
VNAEEARAWSIPAGTPALKAAGTVHSDMERGFIRAEVVALEDLRACGTFQEAKKAGLVRLEGKEYEVKDGDLIQFRFNV